MVNGPASGGENPLGKEYWERQAEDKGYEYDPNKNVPKKTIKVPVGQTQQGEAAKKIEQKFSAKDIAKLIKKYEIDQKNIDAILAKNGESEKQINTGTDSLERIVLKGPKAKDILAKMISSIPAEDAEKLTTKEDIIKYLKEHPELKQNLELSAKPEETKPQVAEKLPDLTTQVEEDGTTHYYKKDPSQGEAGYAEITQEEYNYIRSKWNSEE